MPPEREVLIRRSNGRWPDWREVGFYMLGGWTLGNAGAGFWLVVIVSAVAWVALLISMCRRPPHDHGAEIDHWKQQSWDDAHEIMRLRDEREHLLHGVCDALDRGTPTEPILRALLHGTEHEGHRDV